MAHCSFCDMTATESQLEERERIIQLLRDLREKAQDRKLGNSVNISLLISLIRKTGGE